jgi:hypothetical protein
MLVLARNLAPMIKTRQMAAIQPTTGTTAMSKHVFVPFTCHSNDLQGETRSQSGSLTVVANQLVLKCSLERRNLPRIESSQRAAIQPTMDSFNNGQCGHVQTVLAPQHETRWICQENRSARGVQRWCMVGIKTVVQCLFAMRNPPKIKSSQTAAIQQMLQGRCPRQTQQLSPQSNFAVKSDRAEHQNTIPWKH